ncbi:hypothetical protein HC256_006234 [Beauveria bassiana]|nr:hypothetical protein HC256_006234 [Beauveria bassiana]
MLGKCSQHKEASHTVNNAIIKCAVLEPHVFPAVCNTSVVGVRRADRYVGLSKNGLRKLRFAGAHRAQNNQNSASGTVETRVLKNALGIHDGPRKVLCRKGWSIRTRLAAMIYIIK